jgi:hypothetical protein
MTLKKRQLQQNKATKKPNIPKRTKRPNKPIKTFKKTTKKGRETA